MSSNNPVGGSRFSPGNAGRGSSGRKLGFPKIKLSTDKKKRKSQLILLGVALVALVGLGVFGYWFFLAPLPPAQTLPLIPREVLEDTPAQPVPVVVEESVSPPPAPTVVEEVPVGGGQGAFDWGSALEQVFAAELGQDEAQVQTLKVQGPIPPKLVGVVRFVLEIVGVFLVAVIVWRLILKAFKNQKRFSLWQASGYTVLAWVTNKFLKFIGIDIGPTIKKVFAPLTQATSISTSTQVLAQQTWTEKFGSVIAGLLVILGVVIGVLWLVRKLGEVTGPTRQRVQTYAHQAQVRIRSTITRRNLFIFAGIALIASIAWATISAEGVKNPNSWLSVLSLTVGMLGLFLTYSVYGEEAGNLWRMFANNLPQVDLRSIPSLVWSGLLVVALTVVFFGITWAGVTGQAPALDLGTNILAKLLNPVLSNRLVLLLIGSALVIVITSKRVD